MVAHRQMLGQRRVLVTQPSGGAELVQGNTELIQAAMGRPGQWVITIAPPTTTRLQALPYASPFDGGTVAPTLATYTAPQLPDMTQALQCELRWGAGGVSYQTRFDYPTLGAVFGVAADAVDLNVVVKGGASSLVTYANALDVPIVGAFMVPGITIDPTPLRWFEATVTPINVGTLTYYAVKPWARYINITAGSVRDQVEVRWHDANGTTIRVDGFRFVAAPAFDDMRARLSVPSGAAYVSIAYIPVAASPAASFLCEWEIGLT